MDRGTWWATVHGVAESYTTERLTLPFSQSIYNVMLVSGIEQSNLFNMCMCVYIYKFFFRFFSIIGYYMIFNSSWSYAVGPCLSVLHI